jgi:hypothetical protein
MSCRFLSCHAALPLLYWKRDISAQGTSISSLPPPRRRASHRGRVLKWAPASSYSNTSIGHERVTGIPYAAGIVLHPTIDALTSPGETDLADIPTPMNPKKKRSLRANACAYSTRTDQRVIPKLALRGVGVSLGRDRRAHERIHRAEATEGRVTLACPGQINPVPVWAQ